MDGTLARLLSLVPPPANPRNAPTAGDWARAEERLEFPFPDDLKRLISIYGTGSFDDFIFLLSPSASERHLNLLAYTTDVALTLEIYKSTADPQCGRLVPIAYTVNGDEFFYCLGPDCRPSLLLAESRAIAAEAFERHDLTLSQFLVELFERRLRSRIFPENVPSRMPRFKAPNE